jgi:hypothetical protein
MDTSATPRQIYADRLNERTQRLEASSRRRDRIGYLRLLVFAGAAAIVWYAFHGVPIWWIAAPIAIFILLMWWQARFEREADCARRAMRFFERGIARLENRWQGVGEDGARFADPHHPYASDLDLFGRASLFELLSTARTRGGEERLANWLKSASASSTSTGELIARHQAIDELRPMLELREQLAVLGDDYRTGVNPDQLVKWSALPAQPFPLWSRILALIFSLITAAMLVWWLSTDLKDPNARTSLIVIGAVEGVFALSMRTKILGIVLSAAEPARDLDLLSRILATLEKQQFRSPLLSALRKAIDVGGRPASHRIARLRRLIELLDSRDNPIVRALGPLVARGKRSPGSGMAGCRERDGSPVLARELRMGASRRPLPAVRAARARALSRRRGSWASPVARRAMRPQQRHPRCAAASAGGERIQHVRQEHPAADHRGQHRHCAGGCTGAGQTADDLPPVAGRIDTNDGFARRGTFAIHGGDSAAEAGARTAAARLVPSR